MITYTYPWLCFISRSGLDCPDCTLVFETEYELTRHFLNAHVVRLFWLSRLG